MIQFPSNNDIKRIAQALSEATRVYRRFEKTVEHAISNMQALTNSIPIDYFKKIAEYEKHLANVLSKIDLSQIKKIEQIIEKTFSHQAFLNSLDTMNNLLQKDRQLTKKIVVEAHEILCSLGWWVYPDWTIPSLKHIIDEYKKGNTNGIEQEIIKFFSNKKLEEMLTSWQKNNKLSGRIHILKDVVWAHIQKKYTLSIPVVLPNIEGIINENSGRKGIIKPSESLSILKTYLKEELDSNSLLALYPLALLKFTEKLFREGFEWGKPSNKGRHPILHGQHTNYDDEVFSLKLILLIDFLQKTIQEKSCN